MSDLDAIYNGLFSTNGNSTDAHRSVIDLIEEEAKKCLTAPDGINFANKVVLAIAIRVSAERFMIKKIADPAFVNSISSNQTAVLLKKFIEITGTVSNEVDVLRRVALMTPENIHLNSFMYEPILDMSDKHLRRIYEDVFTLN